MSSSCTSLLNPDQLPWSFVDPTRQKDGIIANYDVQAGSVLPGEAYLLTIQRDVHLPKLADSDEQLFFLRTLKYETLQAFITLTPLPPLEGRQPDLVLDRIQRWIPIMQFGEDIVALFFMRFTRVSHSCTPNAELRVHREMGSRVLALRALQHIPRGTQITISFLDQQRTSSYARRQAYLSSVFRIDCQCPLCSLPPAERDATDARIALVQTRLESYPKLNDPRAIYLKHGPAVIRTFMKGLVEILIIVLEVGSLTRVYLSTLLRFGFIFSLAAEDFSAAHEWKDLYQIITRLWPALPPDPELPTPPPDALGKDEDLQPPHQVQDFVRCLATRRASFEQTPGLNASNPPLLSEPPMFLAKPDCADLSRANSALAEAWLAGVVFEEPESSSEGDESGTEGGSASEEDDTLEQGNAISNQETIKKGQNDPTADSFWTLGSIDWADDLPEPSSLPPSRNVHTRSSTASPVRPHQLPLSSPHDPRPAATTSRGPLHVPRDHPPPFRRLLVPLPLPAQRPSSSLSTLRPSGLTDLPGYLERSPPRPLSRPSATHYHPPLPPPKAPSVVSSRVIDATEPLPESKTRAYIPPHRR